MSSRKYVVTYEHGDAVVYENYKQFTEAPRDGRRVDEVMWADVYDPDGSFTRHWVKVSMNSSGVVFIGDRGRSKHPNRMFKQMVERGTMNGAWEKSEFNTMKRCTGAGSTQLLAVENAIKGLKEMV